MAEAVDPLFAEGIPEDRASIGGRARRERRLAPVDTVGREVRGESPGARHRARAAERAEEDEPPARVFRLRVEPDGRRIAPARVDDVRTGAHVEARLRPVKAIGRGREARRGVVSAHVPHLEEIVFGVVPDAVAVGHRHGIAGLPRLIRLEDGIPGIVRRAMIRARERRLGDEEVVDEELAAHVDRNHGGRIDEVVRRHWIGRKRRRVGRPGRRKHDPVVEHFARPTARFDGRDRHEHHGQGDQRSNRRTLHASPRSGQSISAPVLDEFRSPDLSGSKCLLQNPNWPQSHRDTERNLCKNPLQSVLL